MDDVQEITADDVQRIEATPIPAGYVALRYPARYPNPDGIGIVRERHAATYLEAGFRLITDEKG